MTDKIKCPLCLNVEGDSCRIISPEDRRDITGYECDICGMYQLTRHALLYANDYRLTSHKRAVISHNVRTTSLNDDKKMLIITQGMLESWTSNGTLPSPAMQAENLIRFVGDEVSHSGEKITNLPLHVYAVMGAGSYQSAIDLAKELWERGLLRLNPKGTSAIIAGSPIAMSIPTDINLSLDGWERYEAEKRGKFSGNYGFIAMQFGDPGLDDFVRDVVKPIVKEGIDYNLVDMRDVAQAGIIDDIMRVQIRDSAFVIADLTHDNHGAYWEAGYAEGLGKPVIYICERTKFERDGSHFDTNHCTTVPWSNDDPERFRKELIATLRRSLDLSPTGT